MTWVGDIVLAFVVSYFVVQIGVILVEGASAIFAQRELDLKDKR